MSIGHSLGNGFQEARALTARGILTRELLVTTAIRRPSTASLLTKSRRRPKRQKLEVEPLEPRILLSADLAPFAVAMDGDHDDLMLGYNSALGLIEVHDNLTGDLVSSQLRAETSSVVVTGTDGDDRAGDGHGRDLHLAGRYLF